ncbi:NlpC/P60 family protein [Streptomyces sp. N2-109]|uniref:NlpC/P60 family protein n=1 Tax=Streptomyces gossypii TaxID=2883101 RepID=A0ABT2JWQ9_9ACTN|nr:NlpC/P60 family protein [Streptomyces gossypii]MCT2592335.1 NlpC/P60 family protein [Streptomyces gossypii]
MASHRKPRTRIMQSAASRTSAVGVTTAALASVTLLSQSASAAPNDDKPSVEEVKAKVDKLYQQAGSQTQKYNAAKEKTAAQRVKADKALDAVAQRTAKVNEARRTLGQYAAAQYRTGGVSGTATLLLADDPQSYFDQQHLMDRMTGSQKEAVTQYQSRQAEAGEKRAEATKQLSSLTSSQKTLASSKTAVQSKLTEARKLLSRLTAEEKARLAEIEAEKRAEAQRKAEARAEQERQRREAEREREPEPEAPDEGAENPDDGADTPEPEAPETPDVPDDPAAGKVEKVLSFAKAQLGKPYVWGASGPNSYDCSGFTQAAWKAAGVSLPRTTFDQVEVGTKVAKSQLKAGDLIFFYDDISHVGIYVGDGQMIHASKPGDDVKYESIDYMPFHSAVRPA